MYVIISEEEFEDLITSYDFITKMDFTTKEEILMAMDYCRLRGRLSTDIADYLLDLLNTLPEHELETTESNKDWQITGASAN